MKFYVKDRLYMLGLLPQKAVNYKTYQMKKALLSKLQLSDEDKERYEIKQDEKTGSVTWNPQTDIENPLEIELTEDLANYLHGACEDVSEKDFTDDVWELIERVFDECAPLVKQKD